MVKLGAPEAFAAVLDVIDEEQLNLDEELWEDLVDVASLLGNWKEQARYQRLERELDEKYGIFRDVILHPWTQWLITQAENVVLVDGPICSLQMVALVLFSLHQANVGREYVALAACFLLGVHPFLVCTLLAAYLAWRDFPRGVKNGGRAKRLTAATAEALLAEPLDAPLAGAPEASLAGPWDHIVLGSTVGALHTAASLSRCGRRVLVLEPGARVGGGDRAVIDGVECGLSPFRVGNVPRWNNYLKAALSPQNPLRAGLQWRPVGSAADGFTHTLLTPPSAAPSAAARARRSAARGAALALRRGEAAFAEALVAAHPSARKSADAILEVARGVGAGAMAHYEAKALGAGRALGAALDGLAFGGVRRLAGAFLSGFGGVSLGAALDKLLKAEDAEEKGAAAVDEGLRETLRSLFFLEPPAEGADLSLGLYLLGVQRSVAGLSALRGGVCPLLRALSAEVRAGGGAVYTDCDLSSILQDASGAARGVSAAGRDLRCSGAVISALGVSRTLGRLARLPAPSEALRGLRERAPALRVAFLVRNGHRATAQPACAVVCGGEGGEGAFRVDFPCAAGGEDAAEGWSVACVTLALGRGELAAEYAEGLPTLLAPRGGAALREQAVRRARRVLVEQCPEHVGEGGERLGGCEVVGPGLYTALAHGVEKCAAPGVAPRPPVGVEGLLLSGRDIVLDCAEGELLGSSLCVDSAMGYGMVERFLQCRTALSDLRD